MLKYLIAFMVCVAGVGISLYYQWSGGVNHTPRFRFGSFAPERKEGSPVKWFVDGEDYMSAVGDTILAAENEIFIIDAILNPGIFLKRPATGTSSLEWRLDRLLLKKATEGVLIYVIMDWNGREYLPALTHDNISIVQPPQKCCFCGGQ